MITAGIEPTKPQQAKKGRRLYALNQVINC